MYDVGIIVPVRYSEWVSNIVSVRKKTREIRLIKQSLIKGQLSLAQNGSYLTKGSWF